MGLIVDIYRSDYRSPINVFDGVKSVTVVNVDGPFEPAPDRPAAWLEQRRSGPVLVPYLDGAPMTYVAHGGSYAATSDSRWAQAIHPLYGAVPIHDRDMSKERQS